MTNITQQRKLMEGRVRNNIGYGIRLKIELMKMCTCILASTPKTVKNVQWCLLIACIKNECITIGWHSTHAPFLRCCHNDAPQAWKWWHIDVLRHWGSWCFILGNKADVKASEGGKMALMLFRKFMEGKCFMKGYSHIYKEHFNWNEFSYMTRNFSFLCPWKLNAPISFHQKPTRTNQYSKTNWIDTEEEVYNLPDSVLIYAGILLFNGITQS